MSSRINEPEIKVVWGKCGNHCAICYCELCEESSSTSKGLFPIGEMAHINGEKPKAARYDKNYPVDLLNKNSNLMVLCPTCHTKIDKDEVTYTTGKLLKQKETHEKSVEDKLKSAVLNVTFSDLEVILDFLKDTSESEVSYTVISPKEKIAKNELSNSVETLVKIGMLQENQVRDYFNRHPDVNFSNKVRNKFVGKYQEARSSCSGDDLFYEMWNFASNGHYEFEYRAAALSVLTYFFTICDIFEKE